MSCKWESPAVTKGVPQSSVLRFLLFIIYLFPLCNVLRHHGVHFHCLWWWYSALHVNEPHYLFLPVHRLWNDLKLKSNKTEADLLALNQLLWRITLSPSLETAFTGLCHALGFWRYIIHDILKLQINGDYIYTYKNCLAFICFLWNQYLYMFNRIIFTLPCYTNNQKVLLRKASFYWSHSIKG